MTLGVANTRERTERDAGITPACLEGKLYRRVKRWGKCGEPERIIVATIIINSSGRRAAWNGTIGRIYARATATRELTKLTSEV